MLCRWLAAGTKKKYRLPTEAEWELACRAGVSGDWKLSPGDLDKTSWFAANSKGMTHPVGTKAPSKFGLYDMLGNVGNWATDMAGQPVLCGAAYSDPGFHAFAGNQTPLGAEVARNRSSTSQKPLVALRRAIRRIPGRL